MVASILIEKARAPVYLQASLTKEQCLEIGKALLAAGKATQPAIVASDDYNVKVRES